MGKYIFYFYVFLILLCFIADAVFPGSAQKDASVVFYASRMYTFLCIYISFIFGPIALIAFLPVVGLVKIHEKNEAFSKRRTLLISIPAFFIFFLSVYCTIYLLNNKVIITQDVIQFDTLFKSQKFQWKDIKRIDTNILGRGFQQNVILDTTSKTNVIMPIPFIQDKDKLEQVVREHELVFIPIKV